MKLGLQKIIKNLGFSFLVIGLLFSAFAPSVASAADVELVGNDKGLEIISQADRLFDLNNLNPGDIREANLTIRNKYTDPFELFMRAERMDETPKEGEADLFSQLLLTVNLGDREIYSGPMAGFAASNTSLGEFKPNDTGKLKAAVHLPGPETGDEFQGKSADVKWIFTAQTDKKEPEKPEPKDPEPEKPEPKDPDKPKPPKTGDVIPMAFYGLGVSLLGLGIGLGLKKKKR